VIRKDFSGTFSGTGTGMTSDIMEKIFTLSLKTKSQGVGFGLPICKRIVEAYGETITEPAPLKRKPLLL